MSAPRTVAPGFSLGIAPALPLLSLTDDECRTIARLQAIAQRRNNDLKIEEAYYLGEQVMTNLGIAIPQELQGLRTVIGWPAIAVDPIEERCTVLGFRLRGATDVDPDLSDLWDANNLAAEQSPLHLDALSMRSGWYTVGAGDAKDDPAMIRVESPLNMIAEWDPRALRPRNVLQTYWQQESWHAALYTPTETVFMDTNAANEWVVVDRQPHSLGRPLAVQLVNRPRTSARDGASEITASIRNITDAACRALLNLQVAGEIYAVPMRYVLGATESDFQDAKGNPKTAWQTYITRVLAFERDANGEVPTVGQFQSYDPAAFTKVLDFYAAKMAGMIGATPQDLGLYSEGNPPSADAVEFAEGRRNRKAKRKHALFGVGHIEAMQLGVMVQSNGTLPEDMRRMEVDWEDPSFSSFSSTASGLSQLIGSGAIPATSDVTLARAGFTPVERARLAADRQEEQGAKVLAEIANQMKTNVGTGTNP